MNYDLNYFIKKFEAIPEEKIICGALFNKSGGKCFNGWCGVVLCNEPTKESRALKEVLSSLRCTWFDHGDTKIDDASWGYDDYSMMAVYINNGWTNEYQQSTPKQRILAALNDIKKMQEAATEPIFIPITLTRVLEVETPLIGAQ